MQRTQPVLILGEFVAFSEIGNTSLTNTLQKATAISNSTIFVLSVSRALKKKISDTQKFLHHKLKLFFYLIKFKDKK